MGAQTARSPLPQDKGKEAWPPPRGPGPWAHRVRRRSTALSAGVAAAHSHPTCCLFVCKALQVTKGHRQVWSNPQVSRKRVTDSPRLQRAVTGWNQPAQCQLHLPKTGSKNKPGVVTTADTHWNLTEGDREEERGKKEDAAQGARTPSSHSHSRPGRRGQKQGQRVPSAASELTCHALGSQVNAGNGSKSPTLAPQSRGASAASWPRSRTGSRRRS